MIHDKENSEFLKNARKKIDKTDENIVAAICERQKLSLEVAEYKKKNSIDVYKPKREEEVIERVRKLAIEHNSNPDLLEEIMKLIMSDSRDIQNKFLDNN